MTESEEDIFCTMLDVDEVPEKLQNDFAQIKRMKDICHAGPMDMGLMALIAFASLKDTGIPMEPAELVQDGASAINEGTKRRAHKTIKPKAKPKSAPKNGVAVQAGAYHHVPDEEATDDAFA